MPHDPKISVTLPAMTQAEADMVTEALRHVYKEIFDRETRADILMTVASAIQKAF